MYKHFFKRFLNFEVCPIIPHWSVVSVQARTLFNIYTREGGLWGIQQPMVGEDAMDGEFPNLEIAFLATHHDKGEVVVLCGIKVMKKDGMANKNRWKLHKNAIIWQVNCTKLQNPIHKLHKSASFCIRKLHKTA